MLPHYLGGRLLGATSRADLAEFLLYTGILRESIFIALFSLNVKYIRAPIYFEG